jgi:two-component system nitrogen regulation sensor histidine kinase NtrY
MLSDVLKPSMQDKFAVLWRALCTRDVWFKGLSIFIVLITLLAGLTTYILLNEQPILTGQTTKFYWLVALDIILLLALSVVVGWRGWLVWRRRRQKLAGANLHIQLTAAFSVLTVIPAILVAIFAVVFIHVGVQAWFGSQIRTAVTESQEIARSYMQEHQQSIRADMLAMASDLNRESVQLMNNKIFLKDYFGIIV